MNRAIRAAQIPFTCFALALCTHMPGYHTSLSTTRSLRQGTVLRSKSNNKSSVNSPFVVYNWQKQLNNTSLLATAPQELFYFLFTELFGCDMGGATRNCCHLDVSVHHANHAPVYSAVQSCTCSSGLLLLLLDTEMNHLFQIKFGRRVYPKEDELKA